ncbi:branched-chain amino acid ABC transporter permease [Dactylosporangium sp. CA-092794]|uniref:branched-chain amino acid ABC transporter permease n=1 Tax=Dactylosporangium sp. CA-092794 TaxID=3239929 RepID=UPI003D8BAD03
MTKLLELILGGLSTGVIYALIAFGAVLVYRSTQVINFAHGAIVLAGGCAIAKLSAGLGFALGALLGVLLVGALAVVAEWLILRPLRLRAAGHEAVATVTIGLNIVLMTELTVLIGSDLLHIPDPWQNGVVTLGPVTFPQARVAALIVCILIIAAFLALFRWSDWGVAMRASADDAEAAALTGVNQARVAAIAWGVAGALAAVAAVFLTSSPAPGVDISVANVALAAFPAIVIGGLDSIGGALLGGVTIGLFQSLANGYEGSLGFLGTDVGTVAPWVVMVGVLLVRPTGLFGSRSMVRV